MMAVYTLLFFLVALVVLKIVDEQKQTSDRNSSGLKEGPGYRENLELLFHRATYY